jgi:hypothetical protein
LADARQSKHFGVLQQTCRVYACLQMHTLYSCTPRVCKVAKFISIFNIFVAIPEAVYFRENWHWRDEMRLWTYGMNVVEVLNALIKLQCAVNCIRKIIQIIYADMSYFNIVQFTIYSKLRSYNLFSNSKLHSFFFHLNPIFKSFHLYNTTI